jgi:hypothetical protein
MFGSTSLILLSCWTLLEAEEKPEEGGALLGGADDDDLPALFEYDEMIVDEALAALVAALGEVEINDLMEQILDIQSIINQIQDL